MTRRRVITADLPLIGVALGLSLFGIAMVYSAGQTDVPTVAARAWVSQIRWLLVALVAAFIVSRASVRLIEWLTWPAYLFTIALLVITLLFGTGAGTAASVKGWLTIGGVRLGQPAEIAKITVVLMLARILGDRREPPRSILELWKPALIVLIPWVLIMRQPDLGTGIAFIGIFFAMLYWAGVPWPLLVLAASPAVSLLLAFSTTYWGVWFILLCVLIIRYWPYLFQGVGLILANVVM